MSTSVTSVTKHFPSAQDGFTTTLSGTIASGATTVGLNSLTGYTTGEVAVFVVAPTVTSEKQTFTGTVDTAGLQITNVVWTSGTNQTHAAGTTVVDYATATHMSMLSKGLKVEHNQNGTHGAVTASSVNTTTLTATTGTFTNLTITGTATSEGWSPLGQTPNTVTYNGNRNYDLVFNSVDLTSTLSPGMKLKATRTVAAPSQCTSLNGTTQYYSKTSPAGMTFTDDFVVSAWVKLSAYQTGTIVSRYNGTSGWELQINSSGQPILIGYNAGTSNNSQVYSYQSIPLNKWVRITAQLDMSSFTATTTTSYVMIDGIDVPAVVARAGTNPTALIQAGNLEIGGRNGGLQPFAGKLAQVAIYSAKVTQATMNSYISQGLSGSETSLISAYSFNGVITDLNTTNANNLTANGSAVATNADSPFANAVTAGLQEYAEINSVTFSTNTTVNVRVPETCMIPTSGGISNTYYAVGVNPYGLPYFTKYLANIILQTSQSIATTTSTQYPGATITLTVPKNCTLNVKGCIPEMTNTGVNNQNLDLLWDGARITSSGQYISTATGPANQNVERTVNPASTTATFSLNWRCGAGSSTSNGSIAQPITLTVELV